MCIIDKEVTNSTLLGITFMLLFTAFYTLSNLEPLMLHSIEVDEPTKHSGDGFISLSILYISFALFTWCVSPLISLMGPKCTLVIGALGFSVYLALFLPELSWLLYIGSVCNGVGAAMLWSSQVVFVIQNSTPNTITRNSAIFSGFCHSSMLYGNLFVYFAFSGKTVVNHDTRLLIVSVLLSVSLLAVLVATMMPPPVYADKHESPVGSTLQALCDSWAVANTKHMIVLSPMFIYCGLQLSYLSSVFGAAVGFTTYSDGCFPNQLVAVTGFFTGIGEVLAQVFLVLINPFLSKRPWMRSFIVAFGVFNNCIGFLLSFLNFSNNSIFSPTSEPTFITSRSWIAVIISVLLGFSDGLYMPMLISLIGKIYPSGSASTVTIYTFYFSLSCAVSFFSSTLIGLHWQLVILAVEGILGASCYSYVNKNKWPG